MKKVYIGIDEVGVSSVAGPMVAAAVMLPVNHGIKKLPVDSKDLSDKDIMELAKEIKQKAIYYEIVELDNNTVDELGEKKSVRKLWNKLAEVRKDSKYSNVEIIIDGENKIPSLTNDRKHKAIIKADTKCYNVSAAAIIAKDYCDSIMRELHKKYPVYNFKKNKGYGHNVSEHIEAIKRYGICEYHRAKFVEKLLKVQSNLEEEKNNTNIDIELLQKMVICAEILLNKYPNKFGDFVRGIFGKETIKILNGIKPSPKMQHCLSRNFLNMFREICKEKYPNVDRKPLIPKSDNIIKEEVIVFFKELFTDEYIDAMVRLNHVFCDELYNFDLYEYDELVMMVKILNTVALSVDYDLIQDTKILQDCCIEILSGEIPVNTIQQRLSKATLDVMKILADNCECSVKEKILYICSKGRFDKELYKIFEAMFWIEEEHLSVINRSTVSKMMFVLGLLNKHFKNNVNILNNEDALFCKENYKLVINRGTISIFHQVKINNLLIEGFIKVFDLLKEFNVADKLRHRSYLTADALNYLIKKIDILMCSNNLCLEFSSYLTQTFKDELYCIYVLVSKNKGVINIGAKMFDGNNETLLQELIKEYASILDNCDELYLAEVTQYNPLIENKNNIIKSLEYKYVQMDTNEKIIVNS